jgi:hypothetical protein
MMGMHACIMQHDSIHDGYDLGSFLFFLASIAAQIEPASDSNRL